MAAPKKKPRNSVKTSYRKHTGKRTTRRPNATGLDTEIVIYGKHIGPRTPLCQYIEENIESGLSIHELVQQFQEYDCQHRWVRTGIYPSPTNPQHLVCCSECGLGERRRGLGSATMDAPKWRVRSSGYE